MAKPNKLAEKCTEIAMRQLQTSYTFKLPRIRQIQKYRRLYNTQVQAKLRQQFNVPLPVFAGFIDTLQAGLDDALVIQYQYTDPADYKAVAKANAAIKQVSESANPGAQWADKFQTYRFEKIITGRGIMKYTAGNDNGFYSVLDPVTFEDFHFEPGGGGNLENHIFAGQENIWRTKGQLLKGVAEGIYDKDQVDLLTTIAGNQSKASSLWSGQIDVGNRFRSMGLDIETNNYVGEDVYNLCEWVLQYEGRRWYLVFEAYTGTWLRFEKNEERASSDSMPWISSASHKDIKNFASKSFADDLYPIADSIITLFNQDLTNRNKINLNARAYDRQMFKDPAKLDEAQYRPDALVPVDTFNGSRRIGEGIYTFTTPALTGTVNMIEWLERDTGNLLGVSELQQGAAQPASKKVGVTLAELSQVSKRLSFVSAPFVRMGQQLGEHFFCSLKDYMKEPMSVQLLGETGIEWDVLRRVDLNTTKPLEITVSSQMQQNNSNDAKTAQKLKAFELTAESTNINQKVREEMIFREVGGFSEHDITLLMDSSAVTDKETLAEVSAAIQQVVIRGTKPKLNFNADRYFIKRIIDFATKHKDTLSAKKFDLLMEMADEHMPIVEENIAREAAEDAKTQIQTGMVPADPNVTPNAMPV